MKVGAFALLLNDRPLEEALDYLKAMGLEAVEIATGGYVGDKHCKPAELLQDPDRLRIFRRAVDERGLQISALSCHGNPLHPREEIRLVLNENADRYCTLNGNRFRELVSRLRFQGVTLQVGYK